MRIPTSTIVMGLITCVPFGLAIRDTMAAKPSPTEEWGPDDEAQAAPRPDFAARAAEEERVAARNEAELGSAMRQLYGPEVATLGTLFDGITLGASAENFQPEAARARIQAFGQDHQIDVNFDFDAVTLYGLAIMPRASETCDALERALSTAWGGGIDLEAAPGTAWFNPTTKLRAILEHTDTCRLSFEHYTTVDAWLNKTATSIVPLWAMGQPGAKLAATLTGDVHVDDELIAWSALPLVGGRHRTQLSAILQHGKIVGMTAEAETDRASVEELEQALITTFGTPKVDAEDRMHWSRPTMVFDATSSSVMVSIGTARPEVMESR